MAVFLPPKKERIPRPFIFLAGPIQGAADWQTEAIAIIRKLNPRIHIASPRTPPPWHGDFIRQVDWEHEQLFQALINGTVLFWLAREHEHDCHRAYAQTSRYELGWQMCRYTYEQRGMAVGIEKGFPGERYIRRTLATQAPTVAVYKTLKSTCKRAVELVAKSG